MVQKLQHLLKNKLTEGIWQKIFKLKIGAYEFKICLYLYIIS